MIEIDKIQIKRLSKFFNEHKNFKPFNFTGKIFPAIGHPLTVRYFFSMCKHQFGFWHSGRFGYIKPMIAEIDGRKYKGSDYIWKVGMRMLDEKPEFFEEKFQKNITLKQLNNLWLCDGGFVPLPGFPSHLSLMKSYGRDMVKNKFSCENLIKESLSKKSPAVFVKKKLAGIGGYKEDPLSKKINMLIMILQNRPEKLLPEEDIPPIVDYHIQRLSLRTGIVRITSPGLKKRIEQRKFVTAKEENNIRKCVFGALELLKKSASVSTNEADWLFFSGRTYCPEMKIPDCGRCILSDYCRKNIKLFQPVFRTTYY